MMIGIVAMHFAAFNGLGWQYKLANGFYTGAARQAWEGLDALMQEVRCALGFFGGAHGG